MLNFNYCIPILVVVFCFFVSTSVFNISSNLNSTFPKLVFIIIVLCRQCSFTFTHVCFQFLCSLLFLGLLRLHSGFSFLLPVEHYLVVFFFLSLSFCTYFFLNHLRVSYRHYVPLLKHFSVYFSKINIIQLKLHNNY